MPEQLGTMSLLVTGTGMMPLCETEKILSGFAEIIRVFYRKKIYPA